MRIATLLKNETFAVVTGYEGLYCITNHGRVWSHISSRFLTPQINENGYAIIGLTKNKKTKYLRVHRLVALEFIKNKNNKRTINHINGIKTDNHVSNLEWNTHSENHSHAYSTKIREVTLKQKSSAIKINADDASEICEAYSTGKFKQADIAKHYGVHQGTISNIVRGVHDALR